MPATGAVLRSDWEFSAVSLPAQPLPRQLRRLMHTRPPQYIITHRSPMWVITTIVRLRPITMRRNLTTVGGPITDKHAAQGAVTPSMRGLYRAAHVVLTTYCAARAADTPGRTSISRL